MLSGRNQCKLETERDEQIYRLHTGAGDTMERTDLPSNDLLASNYCLPFLPGVVQSLRWDHLATLSAEDKSLGDSNS